MSNDLLRRIFLKTYNGERHVNRDNFAASIWQNWSKNLPLRIKRNYIVSYAKCLHPIGCGGLETYQREGGGTQICHICDIKHACFPVTDFEVILASMTYFFIGHLNKDEAKFSAVLKQREQFIHYMLTIMICKISEETKPNYHIQFRPVDDADHLVYGKKEFRTACCWNSRLRPGYWRI